MFLKNFSSSFSQRHSFHLVDPSIMPLITALSVLTLTIGGVLYFHGFFFGDLTIIFGLISVLTCMFLW